MKATMRQSGERMFTFRTEFHIGHYDLETVLFQFMDDDGTQANWLEKMPTTRAGVIKVMRERLAESGPYNCGSRDEMTDEQDEAAEKIIRRLFPELY